MKLNRKKRHSNAEPITRQSRYNTLPSADPYEAAEAYAGNVGPVHRPRHTPISVPHRGYHGGLRPGYGVEAHPHRTTRPPRYDIDDSMRSMYATAGSTI